VDDFVVFELAPAILAFTLRKNRAKNIVAGSFLSATNCSPVVLGSGKPTGDTAFGRRSATTNGPFTTLLCLMKVGCTLRQVRPPPVQLEPMRGLKRMVLDFDGQPIDPAEEEPLFADHREPPALHCDARPGLGRRGGVATLPCRPANGEAEA
jgi:hypothetical protein